MWAVPHSFPRGAGATVFPCALLLGYKFTSGSPVAVSGRLGGGVIVIFKNEAWRGQRPPWQSWGSSLGLLGLCLGSCPAQHGPLAPKVLQGSLTRKCSPPGATENQAGGHSPAYMLSQLGEKQGRGPLTPASRPPAVHLWRFSGGYPALMDCMNKLKNNKASLCLLVLAQPVLGAASAIPWDPLRGGGMGEVCSPEGLP